MIAGGVFAFSFHTRAEQQLMTMRNGFCDAEEIRSAIIRHRASTKLIQLFDEF
jgi:hypothetical protein